MLEFIAGVDLFDYIARKERLTVLTGRWVGSARGIRGRALSCGVVCRRGR